MSDLEERKKEKFERSDESGPREGNMVCWYIYMILIKVKA